MANSSKLMLWRHLPEDKDAMQQMAADATLENVDRIHLGGLGVGSFSTVMSGTMEPCTVQHDLDLLAAIAKVTAPGGHVTLRQAVRRDGDDDNKVLVTKQKLVETMKLAGLAQPDEPVIVDDVKDKETVKNILGLKTEFDVIQITCKTPNFEVGSSRPLSFAHKISSSKPPAQTVWSLQDLDDDQVELINSDDLLDDADKQKPDPASLRVCGTTGRRKACKDCSCGLREELEAGEAPKQKSVTSSCGSCYLGDAFRCASCPYLGMPAFKPGEKIQLSDRQLNPDK